MWSYQARDKLYIVEWLTKLVCSMYSDGLSSMIGNAGTWIEKEHQYAKTLRESTAMVGDIGLVYSMVDLWYVWCNGIHGLWMSQKTLKVEVDRWFVIVEILFMRFDARADLCAGDGIVIANRSTSGDGVENIIPVRLENWTTQWTLNKVRKTLVHQMRVPWVGHSRKLLLGGVQ